MLGPGIVQQASKNRIQYSSQTASEAPSVPAKSEAPEPPQEILPPQQAPRELPSDSNLYYTAFGLSVMGAVFTWFWYQHRKEHMGKKKQEVIQKIEERRAEFNKKLAERKNG